MISRKREKERHLGPLIRPQVKKVILDIETSRAYGRGLLYGINMYSIAKGGWSFYNVTGGDERGLPSLDDWGADGAITRETRNTKKVLSLNIPTIACVHTPSIKITADINLSTNQAEIAGLAAGHFLEQNFKNFAYSGYSRTYWSKERGECFCKAIADAGFNTDVFEYSNPRGKLTWSKQQNRMIDWLKSLAKPVAIMVANDEHGRYIIETCKIAGFNVPGDVSILGVDNDTMVCEFTTPSLSSINLDTKQAGYKAAEMLDKLMRGKKCDEREIVVRAIHVMHRESTDIMAIKDKLVVQAVRYIRSHFRELTQVSDVAEAVAISRSALDRRFCTALGRTVQKEIRRVRVDHIAQMLIGTNLTITQIAEAMKFTGIEHVGRYFKKEMGMSPVAYRKKFSQ